MQYTIKDFKVNSLPVVGQPNARYYIPNGNGTDIDEYVTDKNGIFHKVNPVSASNNSFVFNQGVATATWNITHNLNYYPNVSIVDSSGSVVIGNVQYIDSNSIIVNFSAGFSGKAYLS